MDYERRQTVASVKHSLNEEALPHSGEELRYTAVESRLPTQFSSSGHRLLFSKGNTSIFVIITMYNGMKFHNVITTTPLGNDEINVQRVRMSSNERFEECART